MLFFVAHHQTPKRLPGQLERVFQHVSRIVDFSTPTVTIGDRTGLSILPIFRRDPASRQRLSARRSRNVLPREMTTGRHFWHPGTDGQPVPDGCVLGWAFNDRRSAS